MSHNSDTKSRIFGMDYVEIEKKNARKNESTLKEDRKAKEEEEKQEAKKKL